MAHVNLLKQVKIADRWVLRLIPKKANGQRDWNSLPDGSYFIEWRENGKRRRLPAGVTVAQALEVQRRKLHELEGRKLGVPGFETGRQEACVARRHHQISGADRSAEKA